MFSICLRKCICKFSFLFYIITRKFLSETCIRLFFPLREKPANTKLHYLVIINFSLKVDFFFSLFEACRGEWEHLRISCIAKQQQTPSVNYNHNPFHSYASEGEKTKRNIPDPLAVWQAHGQWLSCPHHVRCQCGSLPQLCGHPSWSTRHGHGDQETSLGQAAAVD